MMSKTFVIKNESFVCEVCGHENTPAKATCRNHCTECLCSKHVDTFPGDRAENCHGILEPVGIEIVSGSAKNILFVCKKCGKKSRNKVAPDDNKEKILELVQKPVNY